ncbi:Dihydroorotase [Cystobacter fuscus DSM 2262]|uniref:Dihydroorotase n=1 Tax=Cystobacter fuscus (strain ATCC 25194 / DSM 2262 / NBRC 100088 / M29) TaxID=1242864 RepID=S9QIC3_CYSF2|nr:dihydroorotase [Cystobacter fuscus]EPX56203.1 Dihydroorotase [Cystobacter fuscus DSM 2262]
MKPTTVLLRRGRVIDPRHGVDGVRDVLVRDGVVAEVSEAPIEAPPDAQVVDAQGRWVLPGFIDLHVHLREPGEEGKETVLTGSRSAVAGGFTAVVAMPNTKPVNDSVLVTEYVKAKAREAGLCRVYLAGAITKGLQGEEMAEMGALVAAGCVCITDDGRPVMNAGLMRRALQYATQFDLPVMVHEEDLTLSGKGVMHEGPTSTRLGLIGIPPSAEVAMVARDLVLLEETRGRLHVAHVSCEGSVRLIREAKRRGLRVTAEATPHHFTLEDEAVGDYDTHARMNPPLRTRQDVLAVREALADGTIDAIATDHAPHGVLEKQVEFDKAWNGVVGLETALGLTLAAVREGALSLTRAVALLSDGPARAFGLPGGHLAVGAPADITVVEPDVEWTVDATRFFSRSRNTPFHGRRLTGRVAQTWVGGRLVFENGQTKESRS